MLKRRDAQIRAQALEDAAVLMDSLMATYYLDLKYSAGERDASTAIRTMLIGGALAHADGQQPEPESAS